MICIRFCLCFVLVCWLCRLAFELVFCAGVRVSCWLLTLGGILYIILLYLILYSSSSSDLSSVLFSSSSHPNLFSSSFPTLLFFPITPLPFPILFCSSFLQYSFYTCRYLHILIYIPDSSKNIRPRMFYRSGWLRCVGLISIGARLVFWF